MMSNIIALNGIKKIWDWFPNQARKITQWAKSGMEKDLRVTEMWHEYKRLHLTNTFFWLTDWMMHHMFMMGPSDTIPFEHVVLLVAVGVSMLWSKQFIFGGRYKHELKQLGGMLVLTPLLFNYVTGASMFKVVVWLFVNHFRNPKTMKEYVSGVGLG